MLVTFTATDVAFLGHGMLTVLSHSCHKQRWKIRERESERERGVGKGYASERER
jgi:hypothetical protein